MSFPETKILPIRTQEYVGPGIDVKHGYRLVGVHGTSFEDLASKVPDNAEMVTDFRAFPMEMHDFYSGIALIPKKSDSPQEER